MMFMSMMVGGADLDDNKALVQSVHRCCSASLKRRLCLSNLQTSQKVGEACTKKSGKVFCLLVKYQTFPDLVCILPILAAKENMV